MSKARNKSAKAVYAGAQMDQGLADLLATIEALPGLTVVQIQLERQPGPPIPFKSTEILIEAKADRRMLTAIPFLAYAVNTVAAQNHQVLLVTTCRGRPVAHVRSEIYLSLFIHHAVDLIGLNSAILAEYVEVWGKGPVR